MRVLPCGDLAVLVELDDVPAVMALTRALSADPPHGVVDVVPTARTVLLRFAPGTPADRLQEVARSLQPQVGAPGGEAAHLAAPTAELDVVIAVRYDGPDLEWTAQHVGCSVSELVHRHTSTTWTVAFCGFSPGFAYLAGADWDIDVSRLDTPRSQVRAGSVGLAGTFSGVYPHDSPGGWRLLGHTTARVWDTDRDRPALLAPGTRLRFEAVR